jgi:thiamine pyrophosphate-dependent acetolactate synthase large subunit-like protein
MATESGERFSPHLRGVTVTTLATGMGIVAGVVSALVTSGPGDQIGLAILAGAVLAQFPLLRVLGIEVSDFGTKDHLYVVFMTFVLWFIAWGILLTAGAF